MIYQHPLAYLLGLEGVALLRAWSGEFDEAFVHARLAEVRRLIEDETLRSHPGVRVEPDATGPAYRQWAPAYDDPGNALLELDLPAIDAILDGLPRGTAADVGCGTGRLTQRLAARGHRVAGIDGSLAMVRQARRNVAGVPFLLGDLRRLPLADESVDLVTSALALTHVADLAAVLAEFSRVLRPGGAAIVSDVHPELVRLGSTVKAQGPSGRPQLAATHPHGIADHLRAALAAGFRIRSFAEYPATRGEPSAEDELVAHEIGPWRDWPWTLLGRVPDAARAAWDVPSVFVWHLERDAPERSAA